MNKMYDTESVPLTAYLRGQRGKAEHNFSLEVNLLIKTLWIVNIQYCGD